MKHYGYIPDIVAPEDYVLGGFTKLTGEVLQPEGQWDEFLPKKELQHNDRFETMACTVFGTLNCLEILYKRKFVQELNFSDRYVAIMAGIKRDGGSPKKVIQTIKKRSGLLLEENMPFRDDIDSWNDYYNPYPSGSEIAQGLNFLENYDIGYEWVFTNGADIGKIKEALISSPVGVSVQAWSEGPLGYYMKEGDDNHWCIIFGYDEGISWYVFDTYDNTRKELDWYYDFGIAMRYTLSKREPRKRYWFTELFANFFK